MIQAKEFDGIVLETVLDEGATLPTKAHTSDAGWDLYSREDVVIKAHNSHSFDTGVHTLIPDGFVGMIKSKSGLNVNKNIRSEGVIDAGYKGSIVAKLYNDGDFDVKFKKGQKITQLVILPIPDTLIMEVSELTTETERDDKGFGSSGE